MVDEGINEEMEVVEVPASKWKLLPLGPPGVGVSGVAASTKL